MNRSESINELAKALSSFQKEVKQPPKNGKNPHFKSAYVTLDDTIKAINETAPNHGLSYIQTPVTDENGVGVITTVLHTSGQYIEFPSLILPMDKKTAQGAGSAITYARRYSISSIFGLVSEEDDDANAAEPNVKQPLASSKQIGLVKKLAYEIEKIIGKKNEEVIASLTKHIGEFEDVSKLTMDQASKAIEKLTYWKEQYSKQN